jgi:nifR3 family TIM-barrel protein
MQIGNIIFKGYPLILAPLEDITDPPFRLVCKRLGADLVYTEFISSEGLIRDARKSIQKLEVSDEERPVGIQIFGHDAASMALAAEIATQAGPDLIDINFGCPVRKVVAKGAGAAMLLDPAGMCRLASAVVKATHLPVTVKTRLGWDEQNKNIVEVAERLQDTGIAALSIHGRTRAQLYGGKADWTLIGAVKNKPGIKIPIIGNGDIDSPETAMKMKNTYGVDGIMIGRAAVGYPWIFRETRGYFETGKIPPPPGVEERASVCRQHLLLSAKLKGEPRGVMEMRKHYGNYFRGYKNFRGFKARFMQAGDTNQVLELLEEVVAYYSDRADCIS